MHLFTHKKTWWRSLGVIAFFSLSACSISEEIYFKRDFSGRAVRTIDLSPMMGMMAALNPSDSTSQNPFEQEMPQNDFDDMGIPGVKNFDFSLEKTGKIRFSFDFENLEALNQAYSRLSLDALQELGTQKMGGGFNIGTPPEDTATTEPPSPAEAPVFPFFSQKGKTLIYRIQNPEMGEKDAEAMQMQMALMQGMQNLFRLETRLEFENKPKKVSTNQKDLDLKQEDKSLRIQYQMSEFGKDKEQPEIKIKF